ncbi:MAG: hypothetical protein HYX73_01625 [Acidobacteria bacterium]|nr:hypothetical protein [Acidobacteriota bacterium]
MRKKEALSKRSTKAQRTIADRRMEVMTQIAIETAKRHGEPFRNPTWRKSQKLYPLKYVRKYL